ncbi:MAG: NADPH-dependent FMN reductase [Shimia sp.]
MTKLLGLSGSLRDGSTNTKLIRAAAALYEGATLEMADLNLPLYDGDLEARGLPAPVQTLADRIAAADGVVVSSPEYNKMLSGVLKNALDWVSRTKPNPWADKPVAIMTATAGRSGGERAHWTLRLALTPFHPRIVGGPEMLLAASGRAFDDDGALTDPKTREMLAAAMSRLADEIARPT